MSSTQTGDLRSLARILGYIRKSKGVIVLLFFLMFAEGVFTVATISSIKPVLNLLTENKLAGRSDEAERQREHNPGFADRIKARGFEIIRPYAERIETYSAESTENKFRVLGFILLGTVGCAMMMALCSFGVGYLSSYLAKLTVLNLRQHIFQHMLGLDLQFYLKHTTGALMSRVLQDVSALESAVDLFFSNVIKTPITMIMLVTAMFIVSPSLTLFSFIVLPIVGTLIYLLGRRVRRVSRESQEVKAQMASRLEETFSGMRIVKATNTEEYEAGRFGKQSRSLLRLALKTTASDEITTAATQLIGIVTVATIIMAGGYHVILTGQLSGADFALFIGLLSQVFRPLKGIGKTNNRIQRGLAGSDRVFQILDMQPQVVSPPGAVPAAPLRDAIEFRGVSFRYAAGADDVLKDISVRVPAGRSVAFVGETGAGKSTLVNLIPRFFDPTGGAVLYDGTDLRELDIHSLRSQIAIISQDIILFDDTVENNLKYGLRREITREEVEAAAKAAQAHGFITGKLASGYETRVGGKGTRLSGGEKQRLAIARALLKDAPVLILDEATSALDSETEHLIQQALDVAMKGRTTFVIAHRLSTIRNCDEIYVLDHGRIVESGSHADLMGRGGRYARFYERQTQSEHAPGAEPAAAG